MHYCSVYLNQNTCTMEDLLKRIQLINQQTVGWTVRSEESGHFAMRRGGGIINIMTVVNKFYGDPVHNRFSLNINNDKENKDPDPSIGHADISLLCEIIASDPHSFYWEKKQYEGRVWYFLVLMESLVPGLKEKKTIFYFLEKHLRSDSKQESLQLLEDLCSDPAKEKVKQHWKDVPDSAYCLKE